jgi:hypothetical protein
MNRKEIMLFMVDDEMKGKKRKSYVLKIRVI